MLNIEQHRQILFQMLKDIFSSPLWKSLAFKWWTACYFFHKLERFSTDLDFDIIDNSQDINEKLISIIKKYGKIKIWKKLVLSFGEGLVNIKIDLSRKLWKHNQYEYLDFYGTTIRVQNKATIFANKLVALTERNTNRDIFDVYFFFQKLFPINEELILERTGKNTKQLYEIILRKLEKLPQNYKVLDGLWEVITEKQKFFVKNKLISELKGILKMKIDF